jgi:hypothetical protein
MIVISTRQFREKQGLYLGMATKGEDVVLKSRKEGSFKIVPVTDDDTLMSKEAFFAKLDRSMKQAKEGKVTTVRTKEELHSFLDSL